jgi:hypothetical protein
MLASPITIIGKTKKVKSSSVIGPKVRSGQKLCGRAGAWVASLVNAASVTFDSRFRRGNPVGAPRPPDG